MRGRACAMVSALTQTWVSSTFCVRRRSDQVRPDRQTGRQAGRQTDRSLRRAALVERASLSGPRRAALVEGSSLTGPRRGAFVEDPPSRG